MARGAAKISGVPAAARGSAGKPVDPAAGKPTSARQVAMANAPRLKVLDDGALANGKCERYALFLADGVQAAQAWRLSGHVDSESSGYTKDWRARVQKDPAFIARVAMLTEERETSEASPSPFAAARYTAMQLWRDARAQGDVRESGRASELLFKIAMREADMIAAGQMPTPAAPSPVGGQKGPGRPATELEATRPKDVSDIRAALISKGVKVDSPAAAE